MPDGNCKVLSSLIILWLHFETAKCICDILLGSHFNQYVFFFLFRLPCWITTLWATYFWLL